MRILVVAVLELILIGVLLSTPAESSTEATSLANNVEEDMLIYEEDFVGPLPEGAVRLSSFYFIDEDVNVADASLIQIFTDNEPIVTIGFDGKITYGEGVTMDQAAREFWNAVSNYAPCKECDCPGVGR